MKFNYVLFALLGLGSMAHASDRVLVDCRVATVKDDTVFEESLSREEYPEVTLFQDNGGLSLSVGANSSISTENGDRVSFAVKDGKFHVVGKYKDSNQLVLVDGDAKNNSQGRKWATLIVKSVSEAHGTLVALLICR